MQDELWVWRRSNEYECALIVRTVFTQLMRLARTYHAHTITSMCNTHAHYDACVWYSYATCTHVAHVCRKVACVLYMLTLHLTCAGDMPSLKASSSSSSSTSSSSSSLSSSLSSIPLAYRQVRCIYGVVTTLDAFVFHVMDVASGTLTASAVERNFIHSSKNEYVSYAKPPICHRKTTTPSTQIRQPTYEYVRCCT